MILRDIIIQFMQKTKDGIATLKEIYQAVDTSDYVSNSNTVHNSNLFKRETLGFPSYRRRWTKNG